MWSIIQYKSIAFSNFDIIPSKYNEPNFNYIRFYDELTRSSRKGKQHAFNYIDYFVNACFDAELLPFSVDCFISDNDSKTIQEGANNLYQFLLTARNDKLIRIIAKKVLSFYQDSHLKDVKIKFDKDPSDFTIIAMIE
jgi:hypothetical protein